MHTGYAVALASSFLGQSCRMHAWFTPARTGRQLLAPKQRARPARPEEAAAPARVLRLHATSESSDCSLDRDPVGTLLRLLQNFCSISLDFFALRVLDTRYASWLAAASRMREGFQHASLRVDVPLKDRRALTLTVERDTTRLGGRLEDLVYTRLQLDGRTVLEVQKAVGAEITRQDVLQALAAERTQGAELIGALRATPRPWRGSYVCVWETDGVSLRDAGGVEIEFEKLHADYVAASRASRDAARELSGAAGEGPEQRARKRART